MPDIRNHISGLMRRVRLRGQLPSSAVIVAQAFDQLGYLPGSIGPDQVIARFDELLRGAWEQTLRVLEEYEERSYVEGIPRELADEYPDHFREAEEIATSQGFRAGVMRLFSLWYPLLRQCFLSISQSRKQRGGKDFELQIERLLALAEVPFQPQESRYRTDLILPNAEVHRRNRNISAVVSVKRTLRERWAEVAEELFNLRSPNVFLFTADENVTQTHVRRICGDYNIYLVVWETLKRARFPGEALVLGYTEWATRRLSVLRQNW